MSLKMFGVALIGVIFMNMVAIGQGGAFTGDKVLRMFPETLRQLNILVNMEESESQKYDFWQFPGAVGKSVDIHVKLLDYNNLTSFLHTNGIKYDILLHDLQRVMDHQNDQPPNASDGPQNWYSRYHPFDEIVEKIDALVKDRPNAVKFSIGQTTENREQWAVKISGSSTPNKPVMFINCGIHAREWVGPATCMFMIDQLINNYGKDATVTATLNKIDFVILPVLNADGYVFSWSGPTRRLWRKNRRPPGDDSGCYGVDLNRNFPYNWNKTLKSFGAASPFSCSEIYNGPSAASEKEVQNIVEYLKQLKQSSKLMAYFDIHSYSQMWMLPWGYTKDPSPDHTELLRVAKIGAKNLMDHSGTEYKVGSSSTLLYATTGTTKDYIYGELKVPYTYVLELRDQGQYGFVLPANQILPTANETFVGIKAMVEAMDMSYVTLLQN